MFVFSSTKNGVNTVGDFHFHTCKYSSFIGPKVNEFTNKFTDDGVSLKSFLNFLSKIKLIYKFIIIADHGEYNL